MNGTVGQYLLNRTGNNRLNLSGEIVVKDADPGCLLCLTAEQDGRLRLEEEKLRKRFPFLDIAGVEGMGSYTVKLFAYRRYVRSALFPEELRQAVEALLAVLPPSEFAVTVNIFGDFTMAGERLEFRYLNRDTLVAYKITGRRELGILTRIFTHSRRLMVYTALILLLLLLLWQWHLFENGIQPNIFSTILGQAVESTIQGGPESNVNWEDVLPTL